MTRKNRIKLEVAVALLLIIGLSVLLYFVDADRIVEYIGVENSYLVTFLIALFGGMTSIGGVSYTASIITFTNGGAVPWLIALAAGAGTSIGDSVYYLVSRRGSRALEDTWFSKKVEKLSKWLYGRNRLVKFTGIYLYIGFTPFPNDPLTIALGLSRVQKRIVLPALILGDFSFAFLLAYLGNSLPFV